MSMDGESRDGVPKGVTRRDFLRQGVAMGGGLMVGAPMPLVAGQGHDLVLRNALVMDGSGGPGVVADVAVDGDRIVAVGRVVGRGLQELDLTDHVLAPGFIDIHSHAELSLLINPRAESRIRQGVTLEVVGQDGSSVGPWSDGQFESTRDRYASAYDVTIDFRDPVGFLRAVDRVRPAVNVATMVGQGTVRGFVVGGADRPAGPDEVRRMRELVRQALDGGAVGLSSGLEYTPGSFAPVDELVALAGELQGRGLPYASHMRNEDDRVLAAVEETIHVGRMAGVPVIASHLKAQGERNHWKAQVALRLIEDARAAGVDVHFDRYPYVAYATTLANLFPASARAGGTRPS
jgi:N-acyl-D-amino-acid deacylase